ncbi:MAG: DUF4177 domain-containing protein [Pseudomonadota bacterium]
MSRFEYRAIAAPRRGKSAKGVRGGPDKFAFAISNLMNDMAAEGWEYLRADTLPCDERQGLTGKTVKYHSLLVFRRQVAESESAEVQGYLEDLSEEPEIEMPQDEPSEEFETAEMLEDSASEDESAADDARPLRKEPTLTAINR